MAPRPRKGHRKSRTGCANCKRRKIKCDESKPECGNCLKHRIRCDYLDTASAATDTATPASASASSPASQAQPMCCDTPSATDAPPLDAPFAAAAHAQGPAADQSLALNVVDLELLYNFITSTSHTMSAIPEVRNLWRLEVPPIAFRHEFVMRALLAVSALHMAQWKSDEQVRDFYVERALAQHRLSLREPMEMLQNLSPENCTALFTFAVLTAVLSLATPRKSTDFLVFGANGVTDWLYLLRGISSIAETSREWILSDNIGGMIRRANVPILDDEMDAPGDPAPLEQEHLATLRRFLQRDVADQDELRLYLEAMDKLSIAFAHICKANNPNDQDLRSIFIWIYKLSDGYISLLSQYKPHALLIFGYYSVLLHRLDSLWWVKGWGTHLISRIYDHLGAYYRALLRWPIEEIGWVPN